MSLAYETPPEVHVPSAARAQSGAPSRRRGRGHSAAGARVVPLRRRAEDPPAARRGLGPAALARLERSRIRWLDVRSAARSHVGLADVHDGAKGAADGGARASAKSGAAAGIGADARAAVGANDRATIGSATAAGRRASASQRVGRSSYRTARVVSCRRSPAARAGTAAAAAPVRLTMRGRRVVASAIGAVVVAGVLVVGWSAVAALQAPVIPDSAPTSVVVHPGDSLWSIAASVAPDRDPRAVVADLRERNGLTSSVVHSGQRLVVRR